jgi:prepilin-type N-terminal cleavage/methylation domain-containing protein/prepilin-type processing-associated H-X9-DG protein
MSTRSGRRSSSTAFTLVELLVVIAIIGILVALLLPAVQAAREAARRAKCQNNMKNVALAVLNYESSKKNFPPGFVAQPSNVEHWGWAVFILPYLEEQSIYDRLRPSSTYLEPVAAGKKGQRNLADVFSDGAANPQEIVPLQTPIPVFRCPSDSTPDLVPCDQGGGACAIVDKGSQPTDGDLWTRSFRGMYATPGFLPSASNYMGNRGTIDAGCPQSTASPFTPDQTRCDSNGVFFGNSKVSSKQITDGTSKTLMIGERDRFCMAGTWIGGRNPTDGAEIHSSLWAVAHAFDPLNDPHTQGYNTCTEGFASAHPGGGYFGFCDGSVHFISDDVQFERAGNGRTCWAKGPFACATIIGSGSSALTIGVYQRLAWRNDGLPVDSY